MLTSMVTCLQVIAAHWVNPLPLRRSLPFAGPACSCALGDLQAEVKEAACGLMAQGSGQRICLFILRLLGFILSVLGLIPWIKPDLSADLKLETQQRLEGTLYPYIPRYLGKACGRLGLRA